MGRVFISGELGVPQARPRHLPAVCSAGAGVSARRGLDWWATILYDDIHGRAVGLGLWTLRGRRPATRKEPPDNPTSRSATWLELPGVLG